MAEADLTRAFVPYWVTHAERRSPDAVLPSVRDWPWKPNQWVFCNACGSQRLVQEAPSHAHVPYCDGERWWWEEVWGADEVFRVSSPNLWTKLREGEEVNDGR